MTALNRDTEVVTKLLQRSFILLLLYLCLKLNYYYIFIIIFILIKDGKKAAGEFAVLLLLEQHLKLLWSGR